MSESNFKKRAAARVLQPMNQSADAPRSSVSSAPPTPPKAPPSPMEIGWREFVGTKTFQEAVEWAQLVVFDPRLPHGQLHPHLNGALWKAFQAGYAKGSLDRAGASYTSASAASAGGTAGAPPTQSAIPPEPAPTDPTIR